MKAIQRYEILSWVDDEKLKGITLQTAKDPVTDRMVDANNVERENKELKRRVQELEDENVDLRKGLEELKPDLDFSGRSM